MPASSREESPDDSEEGDLEETLGREVPVHTTLGTYYLDIRLELPWEAEYLCILQYFKGCNFMCVNAFWIVIHPAGISQTFSQFPRFNLPFSHPSYASSGT